jgi:hypothetical protein
VASNYAGEQPKLNQYPDMPIHPHLNDSGPWLLQNPDEPMEIPHRYILTKTHCDAFCSECSTPERFLITERSFRRSCYAGSRKNFTAPRPPNRVKPPTDDVSYDPALVKKAIHLIRHPLDNIVARFHLVWKRQVKSLGNTEFSDKYSNDREGFQQWCRDHDKLTAEIGNTWWEESVEGVSGWDDIICKQEFFQYVQWHNYAWATTKELKIPTLVLYYEDYTEDIDLAQKRLLRFLELPRNVDDEAVFEPGKIYHDYYTPEQQKAIQEFLQDMSSSETWQWLAHYYP